MIILIAIPVFDLRRFKDYSVIEDLRMMHRRLLLHRDVVTTIIKTTAAVNGPLWMRQPI